MCADSPKNFTISSEDIIKYIKNKTYKFNFKVREQLVNYISQTDVFQQSDNPEQMNECIEKILPHISLKHVKPKQYLYIQGQEDDCVYIILQGKANLYMAKGEGDKLQIQKYAEQSQELYLTLQSLKQVLQKHQSEVKKIQQQIKQYRKRKNSASSGSDYSLDMDSEGPENPESMNNTSRYSEQDEDLEEEFPEEFKRIQELNIEIKILQEKIKISSSNLQKINQVLDQNIDQANKESKSNNPHILNKNLSQQKGSTAQNSLLKLVCVKQQQEILGHHSIFLSNKRWQTVSNSDLENDLILVKIPGQSFITIFEPVLQDIYYIFDILMNNFRIQKQIADNLAHAFQRPENYSLKTPIYKEQTTGNSILIIKQGVVEMVKNFKIYKYPVDKRELEGVDAGDVSPRDIQNQEKQLIILKKQDIFGLESLLPSQNLRFCSSFSTSYNTYILKLPHLEFMKILTNTSDLNNMRSKALDKLLTLEKLEQDMQKFIPNCFQKQQSDFKNVVQVYKELIKKNRQYTPVNSLNLITNNKDYTVLNSARNNTSAAQNQNQSQDKINTSGNVLPTQESDNNNTSPSNNKNKKFMVSMSPVRKIKMSQQQYEKIHRQNQENLGMERKSVIAISTDMFQKQLQRKQTLSNLTRQYSTSCQNLDQMNPPQSKENKNIFSANQNGMTPAQLADIKSEEKRIIQEQRKKNIVLDFTQFPHLHKVGKFNNLKPMHKNKSVADLHNMKMEQLSQDQSSLVNKLSKELIKSNQVPFVSHSMSPLKKNRKTNNPLDLKSNKSELYYATSESSKSQTERIMPMSSRDRNNSSYNILDVQQMKQDIENSKQNQLKQLKHDKSQEHLINASKLKKPSLPQPAFVNLNLSEYNNNESFSSPQTNNNKKGLKLPEITPKNKGGNTPLIRLQPSQKQTANLSPLKPFQPQQDPKINQNQEQRKMRLKSLKKTEKEIEDLEKVKKQTQVDEAQVSYQKKQELNKGMKHWLQQEKPFNSVYKQQYDLLFEGVKESLKEKSLKQQNKPIF